MSKKLNLSGSRFGKLTVLCEVERAVDGEIQWSCQCECGNIKVARVDRLRAGRVKSCGCLKKTHVREYYNKLRSAGLMRGSGFRRVVNRYKFTAKYKNLKWELSDDQIAEITKNNCHYCGNPPKQISEPHGISWTYNGIDRVVPELGYQRLNIVPCCFTCNNMKLDNSVEDFINHAIKIYNHLNLKLGKVCLKK